MGNYDNEQERLYRERARARALGFDCEAELTLPSPDVDPVVPAAPCGDEEEAQFAEFTPPNPPPTVPRPPDLLPPPIAILSRQVSASCSGGQAALAGSNPNVVEAGADVQLVYLDEIAELAQTELFRLAAYTDALQSHAAANLIAAIDAEDFTTFDQSIVALAHTSLPAAALIRGSLVAAQERADQIARAIALAGLSCGWLNQALWVVCQSAAPGYAVSFTEVEGGRGIAAGLFSSALSQADANEQAARAAALELTCLVTNEEQDVYCSDVDGAVSETTEISWPVNWAKAASARAAAIGDEILTLDDQGATNWDASDWSDFESNTELIQLGALNGQEFMLAEQVGSTDRRRLRTRVIIEAGDPRAAAADLETANEIAYNLAIADLDCFVPSRPRIISCVTPVYGSEEVAARATGRALSNNHAGRSAMFTEMLGGAPETYGGPAYVRANTGVLDYGGSLERADRTSAFEVYVWPGYFGGGDVTEVNTTAANYGAGQLQCEWISPQHSCQCVSSYEAAAMTSVTSPGETSAKFSTSTLNDESAKLDPARSTPPNTLPRGFVTDSEYPNRAADPSYSAGALLWPDLTQICQSGLNCLFTSCKTACCEPKPDDRLVKVDGTRNFVTWGTIKGPAKSSNQSTFMTAWNNSRSRSSFSSCFGYVGSDGCAITSPPSTVGSSSIVASGPAGGYYGAPARFKYGGLLRWGYQWQEPASAATTGTTVGVGNLSLPGEVKACHKSDGLLQVPDVWGFYHCAEGRAEGYTPVGLGEQARQAALARLDCTHISWPRHIANCPDSSQRPYGTSASIPLITEGSSTREANEQMESILLAMMGCRDVHSFAITFAGGGSGDDVVLLQAPSGANAGLDGCLPKGLEEMQLYKPNCTTEASTTLPTQSSHIYIEVKCCSPRVDFPEKRLVLIVVEDGSIDNDILSAVGTGMGLASGRETLETLRESSAGGPRDLWYIGSYSMPERMVAQAHTGPITMSSGCCNPPRPGFWVSWADDGEVFVEPSVVTGLSATSEMPVVGSTPLTAYPTVGLSNVGSVVALRIEAEPTGFNLGNISEPNWVIAEGGGALEGSVEVVTFSSLEDMNDEATLAIIDNGTGDPTQNGVYLLPLAMVVSGGSGSTPPKLLQVGHIGPIGVRMCAGGSLVVSSPSVQMVRVDASGNILEPV